MDLVQDGNLTVDERLEQETGGQPWNYAERGGDTPAPLLCFSHLRWRFVFQRPQHLMTRMAAERPVFFIEEPIWTEAAEPFLQIEPDQGVHIVVPCLPTDCWYAREMPTLRLLIDRLLADHAIAAPILWYYSPMWLACSEHLQSSVTVYDCMDELTLFKDAPEELRTLEKRLFAHADVVFTGGQSLFEAKRRLHRNIHPVPSSIDTAHFGRARVLQDEPPDQAGIPHPRIGFAGVIDERLDAGLLAGLAACRPDWQFVMVGPTAKINPASLPQAPNIHYLGAKPYDALPTYLAGWDAAMMPFALNEATRFISPTKTPEFLAAGLPVVSTAIADVMVPYGSRGLVEIAAGPEEFAAALGRALPRRDDPERLAAADAFLARGSWDRTFRFMSDRVRSCRPPRGRDAAFGSADGHPILVPGLAPDPAPDATVAGPRSRMRGDESCDVLVVGAGFAGAVMAERLAAGSGRRVLLIDRREHLAGNAFDHADRAGIMVHRYGPHIFHTNSDAVFAYLSRFTAWRPYEHRVLSSVRGQLLPMPINLTTINRLYGLSLGSAEMEAFLAARAEPVTHIRTAEDQVLSQVGRELYELFFLGYTRKQWGVDPAQLDRQVTARVPTRSSADDRYFLDRHQAMPAHGYTAMFERMVDHPNITVRLGVDYADVTDDFGARQVIYTGPIDEYFGCRFGRLPYRSLRFHHETLDLAQHQPVAVVNFPGEDVAYTRVTEYKHLTGQTHRKTSLSYEYPSAVGDPYYPVPAPESAQLFKRYQALADATSGVHFVGRLASYRYYNMDQVVAQALALYARLAGEGRRPAENLVGTGELQSPTPPV